MDAVLAQFRALSLEVHRPLHLTASVIMDEERIRDIVATLMQDPAVRGQIDTQCESIQHALTDNLLPAMRSAGLVGGKKERVKPRVLSAMQTEQCLTNIARSCVPEAGMNGEAPDALVRSIATSLLSSLRASEVFIDVPAGAYFANATDMRAAPRERIDDACHRLGVQTEGLKKSEIVRCLASRHDIFAGRRST